MATLSDDVLPIISDGWQIVQDLGFSPHTVTVRTVTWSGGEVGLGDPIASDLLIEPNPPIREEARGQELTVGPITPSFGAGGYSFAQLQPTDTGDPAIEFYYVVTGPEGTNNYQLLDITTQESFEIMLRLGSLQRRLSH
ncbi:hypothetical protein WMF38_57495 [Sorangium sp. So ce118]